MSFADIVGILEDYWGSKAWIFVGNEIPGFSKCFSPSTL